MSKINTRTVSKRKTHEGGKAQIIDAEKQLVRSVMACMLWEKSFYENGEDIAHRIKTLVHSCSPVFAANVAVNAREQMKLRHVPLLICRELARHQHKDTIHVGNTLARCIQRADELTEFLAIYWKEGKQPLSGQVKKGLALAFKKFSAYDLAKYNRDEAVKLRDVLFLSHAKPMDADQAGVWKQLIDGTLASPDTWEVELSASKDKLASWNRLLKEKKLGALALLRNLRNMTQAKVPTHNIREAILNINIDRVLPFRFITAARHNPDLEPELESSMMKCINRLDKFTGKTVILVDVSGSMEGQISSKSEITRMDAACGVAILAREMFSDVSVYTFSEKLAHVPARRGFALRDAIDKSQSHSGTYMGAAVKHLNLNVDYDRLIVFTDEQTADAVPAPKGKGYIVNVSPEQNGVGYGNGWTHIDGFSESVLDYIVESEK